MSNGVTSSIQDAVTETKKVYAAGKYDWSGVWVAGVAAAPAAFDYISQILAWLTSSPDAPQVPDKYKTVVHTAAFVVALFTRGILARKPEGVQE